MTYVTDQFRLCFCFALHSQHSWYLCRQLATYALSCLCISYVKVCDDMDVDALVTVLKPLKNISSSFVPDTIETVRDVSKALSLL